MIVTDHFVYIHVSRTGGTFLNKLIMEQVPGARMIRYHGQLRDLPAEFGDLPVIGFVRNPWDWYVSMFFDYRRKRQYVFQVLSDNGVLGFRPTVRRFLKLGDDTDESRTLREQLVRVAPQRIDIVRPQRNHLPGLTAAHFEDYPAETGYYSWLFGRMFGTESTRDVHFGRFEDLRHEARRLLELTGTPITDRIDAYLENARPLNPSPRPRSVAGGYDDELAALVADKDRTVVERFGYSLER